MEPKPPIDPEAQTLLLTDSHARSTLLFPLEEHAEPAPSPLWRRLLRPGLPALILIASALYITPLLDQPRAISMNDDWTQIFAFHAYLHDQVLAEREVPQRSHLLGSGFPILAHPEYPVMSPLSAFTFTAGPILGVKLAVIFLYLVGVYGTWRLARVTLALGPGAAAYASLALATCGFVPAILHSGNYPEVHFLLLPWLASLVLDRRDRPGPVPLVDGPLVLSAFVAGTMLLDGHLNAVSVFAVLGAWSLLRGWRVLVRFALGMAFTAGLAAYKLVPLLTLLESSSRAIDRYASVETARASIDAFVGLTGPVDAFALGPLPWLLVLPGLVLGRRHVALAILFGLSALLYLGPLSPVDVFHLLWRLPVFHSMDAPAKYFVFFVGLFAVLLGAVALDALGSRLRWPWAGPVLAALAAVGTALPLALANRATFAAIFTLPDLPQRAQPFVQMDAPTFETGGWTGPRDARPDLYVLYRQGFGLVRWEDNFRLPTVTIPAFTLNSDGTTSKNAEYRGEAWIDEGAGRADVSRISANRLSLLVALSQPSVVAVNQRWAPGWSCDPGTVVQREGRLAVALSAGSGGVSCTYRSRPFRIGRVISGLSLFVVVVLGFWVRVRPSSGSSPRPRKPRAERLWAEASP